MINRDQVINATEAYLIAYDTALKHTKNPNLAVQVAAMVTMTVYQFEQQNQPPKPSAGDMFLAAMMQQAQQRPTSTKEPEDEDAGGNEQ